MRTAMDAFWNDEQEEEPEEEEEEPDEEGDEEQVAERPVRRRFSLGSLGKRIAVVASNVGDSLARTAAAAGELLVDAELRSRSAALLAESAGKAAAGVAKGGCALPEPATRREPLQELHC